MGFDHRLNIEDSLVGLRDELLPSPTWFDAHDEDHVDVIDVWKESVRRSVWFDGKADISAAFADLSDGLPHLFLAWASLNMESDDVGASLDEVIDHLPRFLDHNVGIVKHIVLIVDVFDEVNPKGFVLDELAIHDIDVDEWRADRFGSFHTFPDVERRASQ